MPSTLANSPADVVRWLLVALGAGANPLVSPLGSWPAYESNEPGTPDNCLTLFDTAPQRDARLMPDGEQMYHWGVQLRVRGTDKPTAWAKADALRKLLTEDVLSNSVMIGSAVYTIYCFAGVSGPIFAGTDSPATKRTVYTMNALVSLRQVT